MLARLISPIARRLVSERRLKMLKDWSEASSIRRSIMAADPAGKVVHIADGSPALPELGLLSVSECDCREILELTRKVCYGGGDIRAGWPGPGLPKTNLEEFKPFAQWALEHWAMYYGFYRSLNKAAGLIVDVGCGMGYATYNLGSLFPRSKVVGVDLDRNSILYANRFNTLDNVGFVCGDAFELEAFKADVVFAVEILEHLPAASHVAFTEKCLSLLKSGGVLCMTTPNALDECDEPFGHIGLLNRTRAPSYFEHFKNRLVEFGYCDNKLLGAGDVNSLMIDGQFKDFDKTDRNRSHFHYILKQ